MARCPMDFATLKPMLLDERRLDLAEPGWWWEVKYDGYRVLAEFGQGACRLRSKGGADITRWFPEICRALSTIKTGPHIVDGEAVVLDDTGRADFNALHARAARRRWFEGAPPVAYAVFDLLQRAGDDLTGEKLSFRKSALRSLLRRPPPGILYVDHLDSDHEDIGRFWAKGIVPLGVEGMVAKRPGSVYLPGVRSPDWVKAKTKGWMTGRRWRA